jgi:nucleotide-binding universal stress UspA family protein
MTVVVGDDLEGTGDEAIVMALSLLASGIAGAVHVVHAHDPESPRDVPGYAASWSGDRLAEELTDRVTRRVRYCSLRSGIPYDVRQLKVHTSIGRASDVLLRSCAEFEAGLLVVGTARRQGVRRLLRGSVAERLARTAPCSVLIASGSRAARRSRALWARAPRASA